MGLSLLLIPPLLGIFAAVIRPMIGQRVLQGKNGEDYLGMILGFVLAVAVFALTIFALRTNIRAYKLGERSWVMWLGLVPALLIDAWFVFMIIGEVFIPH
jgi:hypothetical protein